MRQFQKRLKELGIRWKRMSNWRSEHSSLSLLKYILYDILSHDFLHQTQNFELIDLLFSFLEPTRSHSALLAGYFTKVSSITTSIHVGKMEKELEEAVESEDFETTERVSDSLASAERNKELLSVALRDAKADCDAIDSKMQEAFKLQIVTEEECAALLQIFVVDTVSSF
ncbi:hypothetical protein Lser_V15G20310 [Lactuca serriola]